eukprot:CAMPEP_0117572028 /NCGR_PEP_ID=MMETSP0784-20121206/60099_1 /TAXON_ID=39447 /ORGANISM="" /LENGTH=74 /DNA_ID=CAMNT_0005370293 /DNA_START=32 /DNA_END=253 /DNA_ORIENTATION=-
MTGFPSEDLGLNTSALMRTTRSCLKRWRDLTMEVRTARRNEVGSMPPDSKMDELIKFQTLSKRYSWRQALETQG